MKRTYAPTVIAGLCEDPSIETDVALRSVESEIRRLKEALRKERKWHKKQEKKGAR